MIGDHELAVEVSPFTYVYFEPSPGPTFQANATYGYLLPFAHLDGLTYCVPLRVGAGFFAGNVGGDVYVQLRADLGVAFRSEHFIIELLLPSFRFAFSNVQGMTPTLLSWVMGVSGTYTF